THCGRTVDGLEALARDVAAWADSLRQALAAASDLPRLRDELAQALADSAAIEAAANSPLAQLLQQAVDAILSSVRAVAGRAAGGRDRVAALGTLVAQMSEANGITDAAARNAQHVSGAARADIERSREAVERSLGDVRALTESVGSVE